MATSYPQWLARDERKADRRLLGVPGHAGGTRTAPQSVELIDISPLGCRLRLGAPLAVGTYITLSSGDGAALEGSLEGWVAWSRGTECGIDFAQPVPTPTVDRILTQTAG